MVAPRRRLMLALGALLLGGGTAALRAATEPPEKVIRILARRFTYSPDRITLKKDVPVIFELTTADVLMGFSVPDFRSAPISFPARSRGCRLVPDKVGTFTFLCDIFCGSGHETMNGTLTVVA